jgi:hypothetical protein
MTWDRTPLGLEPPFLFSRALRWLWDGAEKRRYLRGLLGGPDAAPGG